MRTVLALMPRGAQIDAPKVQDGTGGGPERSLGLALQQLQAEPTRERFDAACELAVKLLGEHMPRSLLGWPRHRQNAAIAASTLRWWLYAVCPSCRGQPRLVPAIADSMCPTCQGTGRRPMDRSIGADTETARWLAGRFDDATRALDGSSRPDLSMRDSAA